MAFDKRNCEGCNDEFIPLSKRQVWCRNKRKKVCLHCEEEFEFICCRVNGADKVYCSRDCWRKDRSVPRNKCINCGEPAIEKYCKQKKKNNCATCGKEHEITCVGELVTHCSPRCAASNPESIRKAKEKQYEKYGCLAFNSQKQKDTMRRKYGHEVPAKNQEIKDKIRETQYKNNDGKFAFNTTKQEETMIKKYGGKGRLSDADELKRQHDTMMERYGVKTPSEHPEFLERAMNKLIENNGAIFNNSVISKVNLTFAEKIRSEYGLEVEHEKLVKGKFIDLYIPERDLYIDINPVVTHNSTKSFQCLRNGCGDSCTEHKPIERSHHYNRAKMAHDENIKLIQIYDWYSVEEVDKLIHHKLGGTKNKLSGHKCEVKKIEQREANRFLNTYHIQGGAKMQTHCYGLFCNDEMIAVATFGKSRFNKNADWEFIRYAIKRDYHVYGASQKLFTSFIEDADPESVMSYIDFNHTTTQTFLSTLGFKEVERTGPKGYWTKKNGAKVIATGSLARLGADKLLGTNYGRPSECGMNNEQIMEKEGYFKIFTAGNRTFIWNK